MLDNFTWVQTCLDAYGKTEIDKCMVEQNTAVLKIMLLVTLNQLDEDISIK